MDDALSPLLHDLRRWLDQEAAAGRGRVHFDPERARAVREAVPRSTPAVPGSNEAPASPPDRSAPTAEARPSSPPPETPTLSASAPRPARSSGDTAETAGPLPRAEIRRDDDAIARKAAALKALDEQQVSVCRKCSLHESRNRTVFGVGHPDADLLFVGEAPGADEDAQGEPFVGRAGQLLTKIIEAMGFTREDVYIANVLKCRPPNNRNPQPDEVGHCEPYLLEQIRIIEPKVVCALGLVAAKTLLRSNDSLTRMRGKVHDYHGTPLVATYHPAALLRNPNWKRPCWEDVQKLRALYDELR